MNDQEAADVYSCECGVGTYYPCSSHHIENAFLAGAQHARKDCEAEIQRLRSALIKLMEDDWVSCENLKSGEYV